jgi:hypothetical protein
VFEADSVVDHHLARVILLQVLCNLVDTPIAGMLPTWHQCALAQRAHHLVTEAYVRAARTRSPQSVPRRRR